MICKHFIFLSTKPFVASLGNNYQFAIRIVFQILVLTSPLVWIPLASRTHHILPGHLQHVMPSRPLLSYHPGLCVPTIPRDPFPPLLCQPSRFPYLTYPVFSSFIAHFISTEHTLYQLATSESAQGRDEQLSRSRRSRNAYSLSVHLSDKLEAILVQNLGSIASREVLM